MRKKRIQNLNNINASQHFHQWFRTQSQKFSLRWIHCRGWNDVRKAKKKKKKSQAVKKLNQLERHEMDISWHERRIIQTLIVQAGFHDKMICGQSLGKGVAKIWNWKEDIPSEYQTDKAPSVLSVWCVRTYELWRGAESRLLICQGHGPSWLAHWNWISVKRKSSSSS